MKKTKIIIPAMGMLLLGTAASISGTVAWFSVSTAVNVSGMSVRTQVSNNLMIAEDSLGSTTRIPDANFTSSVVSSMPEALLEPVSTINGKAFFFTTDAKSTGDANEDVYTAYNAVEVPSSAENAAFDSAYGTSGAVGYVDYVFQLKAVNTQAAAKDIRITKLDLVYGGAKDASKAYRVAVFTEDLGEAGSNPAGGSDTLKGIYAPNTASNFTANSAIGAASGAPTTISTTAYNTVASVASVPANKTNYYKVVVRLYLEGEDNTCNNTTFANLTQSWALNLELKIDGASANTPVPYISKYTQFTASDSKTYFCDGTSIHVDTIDGTVVTSSGLNDATFEAELEGAFGVSIA